MGQLQFLQCACGTTRAAPIGLKVVSCVRCGREMAPRASSAFAPTPPRSIVATAAFVSQVLGMLAFALALAWILKYGDRRPVILTILALGAVGVFAGGSAHRGSVRALAVCGLFDIAVAFACLADISAVHAFVHAPFSWASPAVAHQIVIATMIAGIVAVLAASACIAAVPQTRRFAAWRDEQILHAARAWRGPSSGTR